MVSGDCGDSCFGYGYGPHDGPHDGPCKSRGSVILWIRKEKPSGGGVDGSRRLGGREDGDGEIG